ncbi:MAG: hypothetical protein IT428_04785 [Planctomycetaceae bacterium]|nr:hypothetical protein [Planctomycetaceae bacterium]
MSWLPQNPKVADSILRTLRTDYERLSVTGWPAAPAAFVLDQYGIDLRTEYAGIEVPNPFGKGSGQLSMTARQVAEDVEAGLGFVVLKTVIAEDDRGERTMQAWAIREARMVVEPIVGRSGETGWTVTWKGRGWWLSFDDYLQLIREARQLAAGTGTLIVPSCKYHLPSPEEHDWKVSEYESTTRRLLDAWNEEGSKISGPSKTPMPIEKDFSPTLAGSDRSSARDRILEWLRETPALIRRFVPDGSVRVGLKLFNALFDDEFQLEMLRAVETSDGTHRPDFHVYGNRLFDPHREFEGHRGVAYGGPDLSDRNLRVMERLAAEFPPATALPWSATGNITTGRMAIEYALRGASTFQLHTFFQLPAAHYRMAVGNRSQKALLELLLHPETGLVVWMHHLANARGLPRSPLTFRSIVGLGPDACVAS